jgi:two-component system LytT family response regulator
MRVLIVDDETPARARLRRLLGKVADIEALAEASDGVEALARIADFRPDAIFLDIEMPELSGLELAASLPEPTPLLVFVTAWDQYAVGAFDADAIDYLLKPYDEARLQRAMQRLRARFGLGAATCGSGAVPSDIPNGAQAFPHLPTLPLRQLLITERGGTRVVRIDEVLWIETADNYVILHTAQGSPLLRQTLSKLLDRIGPDFMQCHRRAAVRLACVERVVPLEKGDCELLLQGGSRVLCSRRYRATLLECL